MFLLLIQFSPPRSHKLPTIVDVIKNIDLDKLTYQILSQGTVDLSIKGRKEKHLEVKFLSDESNMLKEAIILWVYKDQFNDAIDKAKKNDIKKSVDKLKFKFHHKNTGEERFISIDQSDIFEHMEEFLRDKALSCNCEPIGETNVVDCNCEDYLDGFELQEFLEFERTVLVDNSCGCSNCEEGIQCDFSKKSSTENRPESCRNRLRDEGKAYPKSGCGHCKTGGMTGCPFEKK